MASFKHILTQSANGVKTITLNRPEKRNALCSLLIDELTLALREAESCGRGVVILTGAGSAFCAGLDLEHLETIHAMHAVKRLLAAHSRRQLNEELEDAIEANAQ